MLKYIDAKQLVTGIVIVVVAAFMSKYLWKTRKNSDGTVSKYIGNDAIGHI